MTRNLFGQPEPPAKSAKREPVLTTREISRYITFYRKNIRPTSVAETQGVYRNIQRLLEPPTKPGRLPISPQDIADALKNYIADPFIKELPPQRRKHLRAFFTYENIIYWRKPTVAQCAKSKVRDSAITALEVAESQFKPKTLPTPVAESVIDDDPEVVF